MDTPRSRTNGAVAEQPPEVPEPERQPEPEPQPAPPPPVVQTILPLGSVDWDDYKEMVLQLDLTRRYATRLEKALREVAPERLERPPVGLTPTGGV